MLDPHVIEYTEKKNKEPRKEQIRLPIPLLEQTKKEDKKENVVTIQT